MDALKNFTPSDSVKLQSSVLDSIITVHGKYINISQVEAVVVNCGSGGHLHVHNTFSPPAPISHHK